VKFIGRQQDEFAFEMSGQEKSVLVMLLNLFPQVPAAHHDLSRNTELPGDAANQRLLEESLKAQKSETQQWLAKAFRASERFKPGKTGFYLAVKRPEIELLLQVLNDVRIGSWLALGSPDFEQKKKTVPNRQTAPLVYRMEVAAWFQMFFIKAIREEERGS
jgi:hypothetical protein